MVGGKVAVYIRRELYERVRGETSEIITEFQRQLPIKGN